MLRNGRRHFNLCDVIYLFYAYIIIRNIFKLATDRHINKYTELNVQLITEQIMGWSILISIRKFLVPWVLRVLTKIYWVGECL